MTEALAETQPQALFDIPDCKFTRAGLILPPGLSFDHWERIGRQLQLADMAIQWWIGDWLNYGEQKYYERYTQALQDETGRAKHTLANYAYVAAAIEFSRRRENVDFSTHAEVASLKPDEQDKLLAKAAGEQLSRNRVRREAEKIKRASKPKPSVKEYVLSEAGRAFLDNYMGELALWTDKIPGTVSQSERDALEKLIYQHGNSALWQKDRTRKADYQAIAGLFSYDEGTPGLERATRAEISSYLERCAYFMGDSDLNERLDVMVEDKLLERKSVEESRQEGRRGSMIDLYALHPEYQERLESAA